MQHGITLQDAYVADRIDLAYVPILGTGEKEHKNQLQKVNRGSLRRIETKDLKKWLEAKEGRRCYTHITHPAIRAFLLFCGQFYGDFDLFRGQIHPYIKGCLHSGVYPLETPKNPKEALSAGYKPFQYKRFTKAFTRLLRNELWSFKEILTSDQVWPQALLLQNFQEHLPIDIIRNQQFPNLSAYRELNEMKKPSIQYLETPYKAERFIYTGTGYLLYECFREDFDHLDFERFD